MEEICVLETVFTESEADLNREFQANATLILSYTHICVCHRGRGEWFLQNAAGE